jgi:hypothetical protein
MLHISEHGPVFVVGATEGVNVTSSSSFEFIASGKGWVSVISEDKTKVFRMDSSTGIKRVEIHENELTIVGGKFAGSYEIIVGDKKSYQLLPDPNSVI